MSATPAAATPSRVELVTDDVDGACTFYAELFDWRYVRSADGVAAFAGGSAAAELRPGGAPARWWTVFAADDADTLRATAAKAGASVDGDEVRDPLGGFFRVRAEATAVTPGPSRPSWYEYMTTAPGDAERFYASVLALQASLPPGAPDDSYALLTSAGRPVAGRLSLPAPLAALLPAGWMVYFAVPDPDEVAERVERIGGRLLVPPRDVPTGRVAALADPAGAVFTVIRPASSPA